MLTIAERDLIQMADWRTDRLDRPTAPAQMTKARADRQRLRGNSKKSV